MHGVGLKGSSKGSTGGQEVREHGGGGLWGGGRAQPAFCQWHGPAEPIPVVFLDTFTVTVMSF